MAESAADSQSTASSALPRWVTAPSRSRLGKGLYQNLAGIYRRDKDEEAPNAEACMGYDHKPLSSIRGVPEWDFMEKRFYRAMASYAVLALLATFTLDGRFRLAVWIFLAGLAVKTLIAYKTSNL